MSVVIKMDMPRSCGMCKCSGTGVCREWMKVDSRDLGNKRADTCPIIAELPKNHGRLIDADALEKEIHSCGMNDYEPSDFVDAIQDAPTVIESEEN